MSLKKSLSTLKKKFHILFLLELALLFSLFFFVIYIKKKFITYLAALSQFTPELAAIKTAAEQNALNTGQALNTLTTIEGVTKSALLFGYVVVPIVIFLLWCIFESLIWFTLKEKKLKDFKVFFYKFSFITLIVFGILYHIFRSAMKEATTYAAIDTSAVKALLYAFLIFYFITLFYASLDTASLKNTIKKTFSMIFKKSHILFIPLVLLFFLSLTILFLFFSLFTSYTTGNFFLLAPIPLVLYLLVCLVVALWLKIFLNEKVAGMK